MAANPQTNSRLLDSSHAVLAACDIDVTGFNKTSFFILCAYSVSDAPHGNDNANYKMQWRRLGGSFADVGTDTEIAWAAGTDFSPNITDENTTVTTDSGCLTAQSYAQNVGNNALVGNVGAGNTLLTQWGLKFGSGALDSQEYEFQLVNTDDTTSAITSVSIKTAAGAISGSSTYYSEIFIYYKNSSTYYSKLTIYGIVESTYYSEILINIADQSIFYSQLQIIPTGESTYYSEMLIYSQSYHYSEMKYLK